MVPLDLLEKFLYSLPIDIKRNIEIQSDDNITYVMITDDSRTITFEFIENSGKFLHIDISCDKCLGI